MPFVMQVQSDGACDYTESFKLLLYKQSGCFDEIDVKTNQNNILKISG